VCADEHELAGVDAVPKVIGSPGVLSSPSSSVKVSPQGEMTLCLFVARMNICCHRE
jgi:hypothetical protein